MQDHKFGFPVTFRDPSSGQPVQVRFFGTVDVQGTTADPQLTAALRDGIARVLHEKLSAQQVALPTLSMSLPHFIPEIIEAASPQLGGAVITRLTVTAQVPESATQPAAAQIAAAPKPLESAAQNFTDNVASSVADSVPNRLNVNVGGVKVGVNADGSVDQGGFVSEIKSKVMDNLIGCGIVALVVVVLGCLTFGVLLKIIFGM